MRAYELAHTARSAAQLGLVELALKEHAAAERHLSEALANSDDVWIRAQRKTLESARRDARKHLVELRLHGLPVGGAIEVSRDGASTRALSAAEVAEGVWVPEGSVNVKATAPGYKPTTRAFVAQASVPVDWQINLEALPAPKEPISPPPPPVEATPSLADHSTTQDAGASQGATPTDTGAPWRYTGLALGAVGVGAVVTGFVLRSSASTKVDSIEKDAAGMQMYDVGDGNYRTLNQISVGLFVGGAAAVAGGVLLYLLNRSPEQEPERTAKLERRFTLGVSPSLQRALTLEGRF